MAQPPDYYAVLGLDPAADQATVHATWKALLRRYHPDANPGVDASARAKAINEAYAVLGKADARAAYDRARLPPSPRPPKPQRSASFAPGARQPIRPRPSARPGNSFAQPRHANDWMTGLILLIITAAPLGMIVVLYHEESGSAYANPAITRVHRAPEPPFAHDAPSPPTPRPEPVAP